MNEYSVLMSVYMKEEPENLQKSIESMMSQTMPPSDFVLVADGILTDGLNCVIAAFPEINVVRLEHNSGLGKALAYGLPFCKCEWVARMDSDDISRPERCERELDFAAENMLDVVSSDVAEFDSDTGMQMSVRELPASHNDIVEFAKSRNPINHPAVMFKKSAVLAAGSYVDMPGFEDYWLWLRMLKNGCRFGNVSEVLLDMRSGKDMYDRRGGAGYCSAIRRFWKAAADIGFVSRIKSIKNTLLRSAVSMLSSAARKALYERRLRKKS